MPVQQRAQGIMTYEATSVRNQPWMFSYILLVLMRNRYSYCNAPHAHTHKTHNMVFIFFLFVVWNIILGLGRLWTFLIFFLICRHWHCCSESRFDSCCWYRREGSCGVLSTTGLGIWMKTRRLSGNCCWKVDQNANMQIFFVTLPLSTRICNAFCGISIAGTTTSDGSRHPANKLNSGQPNWNELMHFRGLFTIRTMSFVRSSSHTAPSHKRIEISGQSNERLVCSAHTYAFAGQRGATVTTRDKIDNILLLFAMTIANCYWHFNSWSRKPRTGSHESGIMNELWLLQICECDSWMHASQKISSD